MSTEQKTQILKVSASALKTYEQCPKKYLFTYIEKHPRKQWDHFDLGNLCHKTLELFHAQYGKNKQIDLEALFQKCFTAAKKEFNIKKDTIIKEAKEILKEYFIKYNKNMPNSLGTEVNFDFVIEKNIRLRGVIDRLDLEGDVYHIVDYKTTKNVKFLDPFQLLVYGLWLKKTYPEICQFKASYVLLKHGSKLKTYAFSVGDIEGCKRKILSISDKIRTEDTWLTIPSRLCNYCDFKSLCPAVSEQSW